MLGKLSKGIVSPCMGRSARVYLNLHLHVFLDVFEEEFPFVNEFFTAILLDVPPLESDIRPLLASVLPLIFI